MIFRVTWRHAQFLGRYAIHPPNFTQTQKEILQRFPPAVLPRLRPAAPRGPENPLILRTVAIPSLYRRVTDPALFRFQTLAPPRRQRIIEQPAHRLARHIRGHKRLANAPRQNKAQLPVEDFLILRHQFEQRIGIRQIPFNIR